MTLINFGIRSLASGLEFDSPVERRSRAGLLRTEGCSWSCCQVEVGSADELDDSLRIRTVRGLIDILTRVERAACCPVILLDCLPLSLHLIKRADQEKCGDAPLGLGHRPKTVTGAAAGSGALALLSGSRPNDGPTSRLTFERLNLKLEKKIQLDPPIRH